MKREPLNLQKVLKHPFFIAIISGIMLALLAHSLEIHRAHNDRLLQFRENEIRRIEKYFDEYTVNALEYYSSVENYILDAKEWLKAEEDGKNLSPIEERLWNDIQDVNLRRAPLISSLTKAELSGIIPKDNLKIKMHECIEKIDKKVQSMSKKHSDLRGILDKKFRNVNISILDEFKNRIDKLNERE